MSSCIIVGLLLFSVDYGITSKSFNFPKKNKMPFYFVSASDGTNVVKVCQRSVARIYVYFSHTYFNETY